MNDLYTVADRDLLQALFTSEDGFHDAAAILDGLTEEQATATPHGLPHSIADIAGHLCFWHEFFNDIADKGFTGFPAHAADGWPAMEPGGWDALRTRLLAAILRGQRLAASCSTLDSRLLPEAFPFPVMKRDTVGSGLLHSAIHSAHHLGQIVTLRQLLGLWPPKAGSMTW